MAFAAAPQYAGRVGIALSLFAAVGYGASDFLAGVAGRRGPTALVAVTGQPVALAAALLGLLLFRWSGPAPAALGWGAASGLGSGVGILALYRGLAIGEMTVVATLSGVLTALIPAGVGLALGNRPAPVQLAGMVIAIPAVAMVSWQARGHSSRGRGVREALLAGAGFAVLFIALDRAGTASGTWPLVTGQLVSLLVVAAAAIRSGGGGWRRVAPLAAGAGILGGVGNILFLRATGLSQLALVAVISSLYPAVTVLLARFGLGERWNRVQRAGLLAAAVSVVLIGI
jgi:drug/metabolite transporter (DMT)-like permease